MQVEEELLIIWNGYVMYHICIMYIYIYCTICQCINTVVDVFASPFFVGHAEKEFKKRLGFSGF